MASSDLFLSGMEPEAKILPMVYFGILDHYSRRLGGQHRVIGTLLGTVNGGKIEVTNCFPVPHNETDEQVAVDMDYHRSMYELHRQVNPKEVIVGWYATGNEITEHSVLIHEFYSRETPSPVHLCVDTEMHNIRMGIAAYIGAPMGVPDQTTGTLFTPVKCQSLYYEPDRIGLKVLAKTLDTPDSTVSLETDLEHVANSVENLQEMLAKATEYVNKVIDGSEPVNEANGRYLLDTICAIPKVDVVQFEKMFNNSLQDVLMVSYLGNLVKSQVGLQEKLSAVL
jgi:translation initiation factor 3 subunit F